MRGLEETGDEVSWVIVATLPDTRDFLSVAVDGDFESRVAGVTLTECGAVWCLQRWQLGCRRMVGSRRRPANVRHSCRCRCATVETDRVITDWFELKRVASLVTGVRHTDTAKPDIYGSWVLGRQMNSLNRASLGVLPLCLICTGENIRVYFVRLHCIWKWRIVIFFSLERWVVSGWK